MKKLRRKKGRSPLNRSMKKRNLVEGLEYCNESDDDTYIAKLSELSFESLYFCKLGNLIDFYKIKRVQTFQ